MPRTGEQLTALRREARGRLVRAALELFAREGYERTSVRAIAQAAGVAQGLLYNYFEGKEDLLRAVFEECMRDVRESFAAADAPGTPQERLERLIRESFEVVKRNEDFWRLSYSLRTQPAVLAGLGEQVRGWADSIRATLREHLRAAGRAHPDVEAAVLHALIDGIAQHYTLDRDRYPLDAVVELVVGEYCRAETSP